ncbi:hypothetical protein [Laspinema olomoucense]|uniref:Uncharacterized protein n=1 Tax=Laspinema olomoucense D3b TaxID=2953688 RepID=A0ABT2NCU6_9CYAN|nr:hypothetical protein [Laspinema sp. D3b]MCT7980512.1 hypothetical protein [Laspinema sp. D3b]
MSRSLRFDDELLPDFMQRFYGYGTAGGIICLSVWKKAAAIGLRRFANGFKTAVGRTGLKRFPQSGHQ